MGIQCAVGCLVFQKQLQAAGYLNTVIFSKLKVILFNFPKVWELK